MAPYLESLTDIAVAREVCSFLVLFFVGLFGLAITGSAVRKILDGSDALSSANRFAGFILGLVKGVVILVAITYPMTIVPSLEEDILKGSVSAPYLLVMSGKALEKVAPGLAADLKGTGNEPGKATSKGEKVKKFGETLDKLEVGVTQKALELLDLKERLVGGEKAKAKSDTSDDGPSEEDKIELDNIIKKND